MNIQDTLIQAIHDSLGGKVLIKPSKKDLLTYSMTIEYDGMNEKVINTLISYLVAMALLKTATSTSAIRLYNNTSKCVVLKEYKGINSKDEYMKPFGYYLPNTIKVKYPEVFVNLDNSFLKNIRGNIYVLQLQLDIKLKSCFMSYIDI